MNTPIRSIILHSTATFPSMDIGVEWVDKEHRKRGWNSVGYHYVIKRDGVVEKGRPDNVVGAHVRGRNTGSLGIALAGGLKEGTTIPEDNYTREQWESLNKLLQGLLKDHPRAILYGHNHFANKGCPCFDWKQYREWLLNALSSEHPPFDWWREDWHTFPSSVFHTPLDFYREALKIDKD